MVAILVTVVGSLGYARTCRAQEDVYSWEIHDENRPQPPMVDPGSVADAQKEPIPPPSDAIVLFGGDNLAAWESIEGGPAPWKIKDGYFQIVPGAGSIQTREKFGDVQVHVEWAIPKPAEGKGQGAGNSGIWFMGLYEVQVLNSYENRTYPDGQAAALYGQYPPLVNASRPPGMWQTYDIIFRRPHFGKEGEVQRPACVTVFHNGVLVQDHVALTGPTSYKKRPPYREHADQLPLLLQEHGDPVRYRNIWIRELEE